MPQLNFSAQFVEAVESGRKRQTIRAPRKRPIKVGDRVYLDTGARTKHWRRMGVAVCVQTDWITIHSETEISMCSGIHRANDRGATHWLLDKESILNMAHDDGFDTVEDFVSWFRNHYGLPFTGNIIHWGELEKED